MDDYSKQLLQEIERTRLDNESLRTEIDTIKSQPPAQNSPPQDDDIHDVSAYALPTHLPARGRDPVRGTGGGSRASSVASDNGYMGAAGPTAYLRRWDPNQSSVYTQNQQTQGQQGAVGTRGQIKIGVFPLLPGNTVECTDAAPWVSYEWYLFDETSRSPIKDGPNALLGEGPTLVVPPSAIFQRLCCVSNDGVAVCKYRVSEPYAPPAYNICASIHKTVLSKGIRAFVLHKGEGIHMIISNKGVKVVQKGEVVVCSLRWRHKPVLELSLDSSLTVFCLAEKKRGSKIEVPIDTAYVVTGGAPSPRETLLSTFYFFQSLANYGGEGWLERGQITPELMGAIPILVQASLSNDKKQILKLNESAQFGVYAAEAFLRVLGVFNNGY